MQKILIKLHKKGWDSYHHALRATVASCSTWTHWNHLRVVEIKGREGKRREEKLLNLRLAQKFEIIKNWWRGFSSPFGDTSCGLPWSRPYTGTPACSLSPCNVHVVITTKTHTPNYGMLVYLIVVSEKMFAPVGSFKIDLFWIVLPLRNMRAIYKLFLFLTAAQ